MNNLLEELRTGCRDRRAPSEAEKVSEGESLWLAGRPAAAETGHVGLSMGEGHTVIVSESVIREVVKDGDLFAVRVPAGTAALVRTEVVTTLRDATSGCSCSEDSTGTVTARTKSPGPVVIQCPQVCTVDPNCEWVLAGDRVLRVCNPITTCRTECPTTRI